MFEHFFIQYRTDTVQYRFFAIFGYIKRNTVFVQPGFHFFLSRNVFTKENIDGINVHRNRNGFIVYTGNHFMFPRIPFCKTLYVFPNAVVVGMKQMSAILGNQNAVFVVFIVAVACDMSSFLQNQNFFPDGCISFCEGCTGNSGTNNEYVCVHYTSIFSMMVLIFSAVVSQEVFSRISLYLFWNLVFGFSTALWKSSAVSTSIMQSL